VIVIKRNLIFLLSIFLFFLPSTCKAVYEVTDPRCTSDLKISLRNQASLIAYKLNKNENGELVTYNLDIFNMDEDVYILNQSDNRKYYNNSSILNISPGTILKLGIYASSSNYCEGYKVSSKTVNVPYYNKYSKDKLCVGYEDYYLCKSTSNVNISYDEFKIRMNKYIESLKEEDIAIENDNEKNIEKSFDLVDFIVRYNVYISSFGVFLLIIYIIVVVRSIRKKRSEIL